jgi:hypothetical protein
LRGNVKDIHVESEGIAGRQRARHASDVARGIELEQDEIVGLDGHSAFLGGSEITERATKNEKRERVA